MEEEGRGEGGGGAVFFCFVFLLFFFAFLLGFLLLLCLLLLLPLLLLLLLLSNPPPPPPPSPAQDDPHANLPNLYLTTTKTTPTPMLKSLSYNFHLRANFYLITSPTATPPTLTLDDVEYTGSITDKSSITSFLEARTPPPPPNRYTFTPKVDVAFAKYGSGHLITERVPNGTHYWVVAVVPGAEVPEVEEGGEEEGRSAVDLQVRVSCSFR